MTFLALLLVKRISQQLLIRSSISTEFFSRLEYAVFELLQAVKVISVPMKATEMPFNQKIQA